MSIVILDATLSYLRFNCLWPVKQQELNPNKWFYIKFAAMICSTVVILVGSMFHLLVSVQENSSHNVSEDLVMIIAETGAYYFLGIFVRYQKSIGKIYRDLSEFNTFGKPPDFDTDNKRLNFLSKAYKAFIDLAIINFCILPLITLKMCEESNETLTIKDNCGLLVSTWMPFDLNRKLLKWFFYFWQSYTIVMTLKGAAVISFAIMETMEHLIIRIKHLKRLLQEAIDTEKGQSRQRLFITCVHYHITIFDIAERVDKYYTACLFLHVLLSGALFGCIFYRFMESFSLNALCLFAGWLLSLIIVCLSGQRLLDESLTISDVIYNSGWYNTNVGFQKNLVFILMRCRRPIVVHAGPFTHVSHVLILAILKTAYSYMTLLNTTTG